MPVIPAILEAETGGSEIQGYPELHREFKASLGNLVIPRLKILKGLRVLPGDRALVWYT